MTRKWPDGCREVPKSEGVAGGLILNRKIFATMCMFDKFHFMFNFQVIGGHGLPPSLSPNRCVSQLACVCVCVCVFWHKLKIQLQQGIKLPYQPLCKTLKRFSRIWFFLRSGLMWIIWRQRNDLDFNPLQWPIEKTRQVIWDAL
jgi:hypothetical protein